MGLAFEPNQVQELKAYCEKLKSVHEGSETLFLMEGTRLPTGCSPAKCDTLLCPSGRDGYSSRLFFSEQVSGPYQRNWNATNVRLVERNWFAYSWKIVASGLTLAELVNEHMSALVRIA